MLSVVCIAYHLIQVSRYVKVAKWVVCLCRILRDRINCDSFRLQNWLC